MNSEGRIFRFTTFGESHGEGIGVVLDGVPAGLELDLSFVQQELNRRKPGTSKITTQRKEADEFQLLSGHFEGRTTGTPLTFWVPNTNARSGDYNHIAKAFRPSHADYTYNAKYGFRDYRGGGRSSARETIGRVIAGAVAKMLLQAVSGIQIQGWVSQVHTVKLIGTPSSFDLTTEEAKAVRCPDIDVAAHMYQRIDEARRAGDSVGGIVTCQVTGMFPGLGEPIYEKLDSRIASAMMGINAVKGVEIGSGFSGVEMYGSEHNDSFIKEGGQIRTATNFSGGVQGGISNGEPLIFRVAFKPTATIMQAIETLDEQGNPIQLPAKGRHDPCVVPRAVPIVEAMCATVLLDLLLLQRSKTFPGLFPSDKKTSNNDTPFFVP